MASADPADLQRLRAVLEQARGQRTTLTYLQVADALDVAPPHRIHKTARLIERLLKQDVEAGRTPLAALAVSKARDGLPAPGFFDRAERLGAFDGEDPKGYHRRVLAQLFDAGDPP